MRRLWFLMFVVACSLDRAAAAPKSTQLQMKRDDAEAVHIADNSGAINTREEWQVTVDLAPAGTLAVTSTGMRGEHNLFAGSSTPYNTDDDTTWSTRWTGRWTQKGRTLRLVLAVAEQTCKHTKTIDAGTPEVLTCKPADKTATLACKMDDVDVLDATTLAPAGKQGIWRCTATKGGLGEATPDWTLGRPGCVMTVGGHRTPLQFRRC